MNTCISLIVHSYILSILLTNILVTKIPGHAYVQLLAIPPIRVMRMPTCIPIFLSIVHLYILLILLTNIYLLYSETFNTAYVLRQYSWKVHSLDNS